MLDQGRSGLAYWTHDSGIKHDKTKNFSQSNWALPETLDQPLLSLTPGLTDRWRQCRLDTWLPSRHLSAPQSHFSTAVVRSGRSKLLNKIVGLWSIWKPHLLKKMQRSYLIQRTICLYSFWSVNWYRCEIEKEIKSTGLFCQDGGRLSWLTWDVENVLESFLMDTDPK